MIQRKSLLFVFILVCVSLHAFVLPPVWIFLGEKTISYQLDRDEIIVTGNKGKFSALKFRVIQAPINLHHMKVHYANGQVQELEFRMEIPAGGESCVMDLPGDRRIIQKVVFWYDTKNPARKKARLELWGRR